MGSYLSRGIEYKCHKLDKVFNNINLYFANTLYNATYKKVSCNLCVWYM